MATKTLGLSFQTAGGRNLQISVPDPKDDLTAAEVQAAMNTIVQKNIFATSTGDVTAALGARITTRDITNLVTV